MKRSEKVLLNKKDIAEAILWATRDEFGIPRDYEFDRDITVTIDQVDQFKPQNALYIEATLNWEEDDD